MLRPYQQKAVDASIAFLRKSVDPFLIEAATGAGKSHIIAAVAQDIHERTGKRILCLAPGAELVMQNAAKYALTGNPYSIYSASVGVKHLRHPVVFGTPLTVANRISRFRDDYAIVVLDECHRITSTVKGIISSMREGNERLRVMGLTATPYRRGEGYIFRVWPDDEVNSEEEARDPYFVKCVANITARELLAQGYLTPPVIGQIHAGKYATMGLDERDADAVDRAYHGHGRLTASIVADVVAQSRDRRGVLLYAATVRHAQEILASLPPELSAIVTRDTPAKERKRLLERFLAQEIKYLVNVGVLTTGFDAPHVDVIAILRRTESESLLQQIIGRGLRLYPGKKDVLVLDYTTNMEEHFPDGDVFAPVIKASGGASKGVKITAKCEWCGYENQFTATKELAQNPDMKFDEYGYVLDLDGRRVETEYGALPAHYGRRCVNLIQSGVNGTHERCGYFWTHKVCPKCEEKNDITARYCMKCKTELVNPNEKLRGEFRALKKDPTKRQTDIVLDMVCKPSVSRAGNNTLRVDFTTPYRTFCVWLSPESPYATRAREYAAFCDATGDGTHPPETVTYKKEESGFYKVLGYNGREDREPE